MKGTKFPSKDSFKSKLDNSFEVFKDQSPSLSASNITKQLLSRIANIEKEDVDHLHNYFDDRIQIQKDSIEDWYVLQSDVYNQFRSYKSDTYNSEHNKADDNLDSLTSSVGNDTLFRKGYVLDIDKKLNIDLAQLTTSHQWYNEFKKAQSNKFISSLNNISKKMVELRLPNALKDKRKGLITSIDNAIKIIDKSNSQDGVSPFIKHNLTELYKYINELQAIDNIIPQIIKDLNEKPDEFIRELSPIINDFISKLEAINKDFGQNTFKDSSNKSIYDKIERDEPNKIRANSYGIELTSQILATLKPSKYLNPSIVHFYLSFLNEKIETSTNQTLAEGEKIFLSTQLVELYGGEDVLYLALGKDKISKKSYRRFGYLFHIDLNHFIFVEFINNSSSNNFNSTGFNTSSSSSSNKSELIIYDSNFKEYEHAHVKLKSLFAEIIGDDQLAKTSYKFGYSGTKDKFAATTMGSLGSYERPYEKGLLSRAGNCPQQMNNYDSAVFALKNANLFSENKKIMQGSYIQNEIVNFRYEIFNMIIKTGKVDDVDFAYKTADKFNF